jgi:hypothetical protein
MNSNIPHSRNNSAAATELDGIGDIGCSIAAGELNMCGLSLDVDRNPPPPWMLNKDYGLF